MKTPIYVNEHMISIFLKELVRRAMVEIQRQRFAFEATSKHGYGTEEMNDVFTSADTAAQDLYEKSIREALPGIGIIGEEDLKLPCTLDEEFYITVDPLDGTKAFVRQQSHGISTMVALVREGEVISAWIGDINTSEIFGYRPDTDTVHRLHNFRPGQRMNEIDRNIELKDAMLLRRTFPNHPSELEKKTHKIFRDVHIDGSSIGTWFSRLWKGEMHALLIDPSYETPWDSTPVYGISKQLGFVYLKPEGEKWVEYDPGVTKEMYERDHIVLVVHKDFLEKLPEDILNK